MLSEADDASTYAFYSIVSAGEGWVVRLNQRDIGPPCAMEAAVDTAVRAAARGYRPGFYVHVVLDDGKRARTLWLNGRLTSGQETERSQG
jgi:hypothetical protein